MSRSIVVVSNAPCLKGSGLGEIIDSFDDVVRFNAFSTKGFEQDVGTKTTIWSRFHRLEKRPQLASGTRRLSRHYPKNKRHAAVVAGCELIPLQINEWCKKQIWQKEEFVSSGLLVFAYLLEEYSVMHAAGFYRSDLSQKAFARHYWQPKRKGKNPKGHQPTKEKILFDRWVEEGRIIELPLPGDDAHGHLSHWSNPCAVRVQEVPWKAAG